MARTRLIHPGASIEEDVAVMSIAARLLWAYLPCHADREGRLKDSAFSIKAAIFPVDPIDVNALLDELAAAKHIIRYQADGKRIIQIRNFRKYQSPHRNESESTIPPPPTHDNSRVVANNHEDSLPSGNGSVSGERSGEGSGASLAGDPAGPEDGVVAREVIQEAFRSALAEDQPKPWTAGGWKRHFGEFWVSRYGGNAYGGGVDAAKVCGIFDDHLAALPTEARLKAQARAPAMFTKYFGDRKLASMKHPFRFFVDRFDSLRTDGDVVNGAQPARRQTDRPEIPSYFREAKPS